MTLASTPASPANPHALTNEVALTPFPSVSSVAAVLTIVGFALTYVVVCVARWCRAAIRLSIAPPRNQTDLPTLEAD